MKFNIKNIFLFLNLKIKKNKLLLIFFYQKEKRRKLNYQKNNKLEN
jgi:hypothetical protein